MRLAVGAGKAAPVRGCVLPWWVARRGRAAPPGGGAARILVSLLKPLPARLPLISTPTNRQRRAS